MNETFCTFCVMVMDKGARDWGNKSDFRGCYLVEAQDSNDALKQVLTEQGSKEEEVNAILAEQPVVDNEFDCFFDACGTGFYVAEVKEI